MKIYHLGAELFCGEGQTDGPTDVLKLIVAFRNFVNAPRYRWKQSLLILRSVQNT